LKGGKRTREEWLYLDRRRLKVCINAEGAAKVVQAVSRKNELEVEDVTRQLL